jgi:hypothetical protein
VLPIAKDVAVEVAKDVVRGMIEQQTGGNIKDTINKSKIVRKTKNVLKNHVLPIARDVAVEVAKYIAKGMIESQQTGGNIKDKINKSKIARKIKNVLNNQITPTVVKVGKEVAKQSLKSGALAIAESNSELLPFVPVANVAIDRVIGSGMKKKNRAEIVKKIMKEQNLKMIDASSYVKKHNLY